MNFITHISKYLYPLDNPIENSPQQLANMPDNLMVEIFNHLPFIDLSNAALVSKRWNHVSQDPILKLKLFYQLTKAVLKDTSKSERIALINFPEVIDCRVTFKNSLQLEIEDISKKENLTSQADFEIIDTGYIELNLGPINAPEVDSKIINQSLNPERKQFIQKAVQAINQIILNQYQRQKKSFSSELKVVGVGLIHMTPLINTIYDLVTNLK